MWQSVELRELRVFLTLAEELHFGRAAERLHLTHSRVSQSVASLETKVGGRLFERTSRRVELTPLGESLRTRIAPAYQQIQSALADLNEQTKGIAGAIRLGIYSRIAAGPNLIQIVRTFEGRHPNCQVHITEVGLDPGQFDRLRRGELDLLVMRLPLSDPDFVVGPVLQREERVLLLARDHPLAGRESVSVEDFADYVTTDVEGAPREVMDNFSPPVSPSGRPIRRAYLHSISEAALRAATGELVHPTVPAFLEAYPQPELTSVPIRDMPPAETALLRLKASRSAKVLAFVEMAAAMSRGNIS
jgi:DNA-binding transcriptional LysR family regulator